ncbi:MAG TPA: ABC transporter ATP-binding protein [Polyangiaceae bacterium]|nr:ABC transporter ATP-binding protein [Polyangiaceae bacterium]
MMFGLSRELIEPEPTPVLSASGLSKSYAGVRAVRNVSLEVRPGRALGLLGPNGAGKSTTLLLLAGVLKPDAGTIRVQDELDSTRPSVRRALGYVPQSVALYLDLTARENLILFGKLYGLSGVRLQQRVSAALALAQLTDRADARVRTFSGGMQRRLNLAAATVHAPRVLLLDEPTVGVDPQSRAHLFSCIETLKRSGVGIVYSTHYLEEAERLCDTISIIDRGTLLATGSRDELIRASGSPLAGNGKETTGRVPRRPDLESVFLNLTGRSMRDA